MQWLRKTFQLGKLRFTTADFAALIVFVSLSVCLFLSAPIGITENDEALYQVYEQRLMKGDKLFLDDWTLTPFSTIFNYLPFAAFYTLTGGTAGVLLALRYFYAGCKLLAFALVYLGLRKNGYWAVAAATVFACAFAFGMKTLNYYFICGCALLFTGYALFLKPGAKPFVQIAAGFVFSLGVMAEPSMAALWAAYTLLALAQYIAKKKNARLLEAFDALLAPEVWRRFFYGILAAAGLLIVLCAAFFMRAAPAALWQGFLRALRDPERSSGLAALLSGRLEIVLLYVRIFHPALLHPYLALIALSFVFHRFFRKAEPVIFVLLTALCAALTLRLLLYPMREIGFAVGETICHPLPLGLLAIAVYAQTAQKNRLAFGFLLFGFGALVCGDLISMTAFGAFSEVLAVPALLLLRDRAKEIFAAAPETEKKKKSNAKPFGSRLLCAAMAAVMIFIPLSEAAHMGYLLRLHETERLFVKSDAPLDTVISSGALKGIVTTAEIAGNYEKSVRDAEMIRAMCENRLYVADLAPSVYLDADMPMAAHSPYYYYQEGWERVSIWWDMHPEKRPDVIYIPAIKFSYMEYPDASVEEKISWLRKNAEIEVYEGEIGSIIKILRWKQP